MLTTIVLVSLGFGPVNGKEVPKHPTGIEVTQTVRGDYRVRYFPIERSTHAPKRNAAHFAADEGNNGVYPVTIAKRF